MLSYWIRHRLLATVILSVVIALISALLFVFPYINQEAIYYNNQSVYKNSNIDFVVPEPSFEQVRELQGTNGIEKVFPFFLTKIPVNANGDLRTTTVLLSDQFQNIDITMYNDSRLIEKSKIEYENPILIDWQFSKETSSKLGDSISFEINGRTIDYQVYAIYETNNIYNGGAVLVQLSAEQKEQIMKNSKNTGYSGMYILANDYNACRTYLTTKYKPLGRLKDKSRFDTEEQYQTHYNTIINSNYSNEITDFKLMENNSEMHKNSLLVWVGALIIMSFVIAYNLFMSNLGSEKGYFEKNSIPKGIDVNSYYSTSFFAELIMSIVAYVCIMFFRVILSSNYIPRSVIDYNVLIIPLTIFVSEIICLGINKTKVSRMVKIYKFEQVAKKKVDE